MGMLLLLFLPKRMRKNRIPIDRRFLGCYNKGEGRLERELPSTKNKVL